MGEKTNTMKRGWGDVSEISELDDAAGTKPFGEIGNASNNVTTSVQPLCFTASTTNARRQQTKKYFPEVLDVQFVAV